MDHSLTIEAINNIVWPERHISGDIPYQCTSLIGNFSFVLRYSPPTILLSTIRLVKKYACSNVIFDELQYIQRGRGEVQDYNWDCCIHVAQKGWESC